VGGAASVRISKVRADASTLLTQRILSNPGNPQPTAITGQVTLSAAAMVPVSNALETMANASTSMVFTGILPIPASGGAQTVIPLVFQESRAASFQPASTRLHVSLSNVPADVQIYAPVYPQEGNVGAQLYSADTSGSGGSPVLGTPIAGGTNPGISYQPLNATNGTMTATWVVQAADPGLIETFTFPLLVLNASSAALQTLQVSGSLGPVSTVGIASDTAPVPRYRDFSVQPSLTNLRVTTSVATQGSASPANSLARPEAFMAPNAAPSGLYLLFSHQVVNDTSDSSQTATNVVVRDNLSAGLTLISCSYQGASCGISGNQIQVNAGSLAGGQSTTVVVVAQVDPSLAGALDNAASATSDEVNLDLSASTSSSSFIAPGGLPAVAGGAPASGSGTTQTFAFQFSDPAGYQSLGVVNILINNFLDGRNACYLAYEVQNNRLDLVDDGGDAGGPFASVVLGSSSTIQNSQCAVSLISAQGNGNNLVLTLSITFKAAFGGNKITYVAARDQAQGNSNWQALGVWQVPFTTGTTAVASVSPPRGTGTGQQFVLTVTDSNGIGDLGVVNLLINRFLDGRRACYLAYSQPDGMLYLVDDAGDAGGPFAGQMRLNGSNLGVQNGQCSVNGSGSTVSYSANTMTLTLNVSFAGAFAGNQVVYAAGRDRSGGNNTGWQSVGTWTVQ